MRSKVALFLIVVLAFQGLLLFVPKQAAYAAPTETITNFVTRQGDKLIDGNEEFRFISANAPTLTFVEDIYWHLPDPWEQEDALKALKQMGATATRTYTLSVKKGSDYTGQIRHVMGPGQFNEQAFQALDRAIALAHQYGVRLIIPFVDQYEWWGGITSYAAFRGKGQDAFWSDEQIIADFKATINYVLNRTNTITGVAYKDDPAILAWETGNELVPKNDAWTPMIASYIKSIDANHLVLDGRYGIDDASLADNSPVDIVSNHYYPNHYGDYTLQANLDRDKSKGKKPFIIGEFGFLPPDKMGQMLDAVVDNGTTGAMLWSLRYHNKDGGFYPHTESTYNGVFYGSYRWPGFPSGDGFGETVALQTLSDHAYKIRGLSNPGLPVPDAPVLLPIDSVSAISWRGSAGAQYYSVERAESAGGPWTVLNDRAYDAVSTNGQLFDDATSVTGVTYYYRVKAVNASGESPYSDVVATTAKHEILDSLENNARMYEYTPDLKSDMDNEGAFGGDGTRLMSMVDASGPQYIGYALPSVADATYAGSVQPLSLQVEVYFDKDKTDKDFTFYASEDGQSYSPITLARTDTDLGANIKSVYTSDTLPPAAKYFRIQFPEASAAAKLGKVALEYSNTSGAALVYPEPRTKQLVTNGVLTDEMNNTLKMDSHTPNLGFLSDQPEYFGGDPKRFVQTTDTQESFVYHTGGDMNYFKLLAYMKQDPAAYTVPDFKIYTSADAVAYAEYGSAVKNVTHGDGWWDKTQYIGYTLPAGTRYLKFEFPKLPEGHEGDTWNPQVSQIVIGVGDEKLEPPSNAGKSSVIDDFEGYSGSSGTLRGAYTPNSGGAPITLTLDGTHKDQGNYALKLEAGFTDSTGWGGVERSLAKGDWSGNSGIRLWIDPNGVDEGVTIQFNEGDDTGGEVWKAAIHVSGNEPRIIEIPFSKFALADWWKSSHPGVGNGKIDLGHISVFSIYVDGAAGSKAIYFDSITLYRSPVIDNFEGYDGDNGKLQAAYRTNDSGDAIVPTLSVSDKVEGGFGVILNYTLTDAKGYAGLTKALGGVDLSGYNGIQFWLKSADAGRGLTVQLKESSGEYWETKLTVDGNNGQWIRLPFQTFAIPRWSTPVNGQMDLNAIDEISIYVDKGSKPPGAGSISLDDIQAAPFDLIEDFEHYDGNNDRLSHVISVNTGGDVISATLDGTIKHEGAYAMKLDYTLTDEKGYAGITEHLGAMDWSRSGNALSFWVKSGGASHHDLMIQIAETDGDLWEAHAPIPDSGESTVQIPFASFARNAEWSQGNGKLTLDTVKELSIYVNKGSGGAGSQTLYLDDFKIATVSELDDFEYYDGGELVAKTIYTANPWGGNVTMYPDAGHKQNGRNGVKFDYSLPAADRNFAGVTKLLGGMDWSGYDGVQFWLVPDGSNHKLVYQFKETDGETWETYFTLSGTEPVLVKKPFSEFKHAPWNTNGNGHLDLQYIREFSLYVNQENGALGTGTLYFDNIRLYPKDDGSGGDAMPPVTSARTDPAGENGWFRSDVGVTLTAQDDVSGVDKTEYKLSTNDAWQNYAGPITLSNEGVYQLQFRSTDKAGNVEQAKQLTVSIDKTAPTYSLTANGSPLADGTIYQDNERVTFQLADSDELSGVASQSLTLDGQSFDNGSAMDLAGKPGVHTLHIVVADKASNTVDATLSFKVETGILSVRSLIERFTASGDLSGPLVPQLTNQLDQAEHQLDKGSADQAVKFMQNFLKHLDNEPQQGNVTAAAKAVMTVDAQTLIKVWSSGN